MKQNASGSTVDKTEMPVQKHMEVICYSARDVLFCWLQIVAIKL
jgi:hypothetical protein